MLRSKSSESLLSSWSIARVSANVYIAFGICDIYLSVFAGIISAGCQKKLSAARLALIAILILLKFVCDVCKHPHSCL